MKSGKIVKLQNNFFIFLYCKTVEIREKIYFTTFGCDCLVLFGVMLTIVKELLSKYMIKKSLNMDPNEILLDTWQLIRLIWHVIVNSLIN